MKAPAASMKYATAKYEAVQKLIANHSEEYEAIFNEAKLRYGITPRLTTAQKIAQLEQTIAELKKVKQ
jgi:pyruvate formate-lyase activating enzyme-like uncharacterized protein